MEAIEGKYHTQEKIISYICVFLVFGVCLSFFGIFFKSGVDFTKINQEKRSFDREFVPVIATRKLLIFPRIIPIFAQIFFSS